MFNSNLAMINEVTVTYPKLNKNRVENVINVARNKTNIDKIMQNQMQSVILRLYDDAINVFEPFCAHFTLVFKIAKVDYILKKSCTVFYYDHQKTKNSKLIAETPDKLKKKLSTGMGEGNMTFFKDNGLPSHLPKCLEAVV
jgi:hypothetical protein